MVLKNKRIHKLVQPTVQPTVNNIVNGDVNVNEIKNRKNQKKIAGILPEKSF